MFALYMPGFRKKQQVPAADVPASKDDAEQEGSVDGSERSPTPPPPARKPAKRVAADTIITPPPLKRQKNVAEKHDIVQRSLSLPSTSKTSSNTLIKREASSMEIREDEDLFEGEDDSVNEDDGYVEPDNGPEKLLDSSNGPHMSLPVVDESSVPIENIMVPSSQVQDNATQVGVLEERIGDHLQRLLQVAIDNQRLIVEELKEVRTIVGRVVTKVMVHEKETQTDLNTAHIMCHQDSQTEPKTAPIMCNIDSQTDGPKVSTKDVQTEDHMVATKDVQTDDRMVATKDVQTDNVVTHTESQTDAVDLSTPHKADHPVQKHVKDAVAVESEQEEEEEEVKPKRGRKLGTTKTGRAKRAAKK